MLLFGAGHAVEDKSNGSNQGGPTQRASALAALSTAFNPSSGSKTAAVTAPAPRAAGVSQGSQRAAAVAALSQVLTAEKKKSSPDASPARPSRSPPSETRSPPSETKSENVEAEVSQEVSEVKETEEATPVPESNGEDSTPKREAEQDENDSENSQSTFSYDQLKAKSDNPVTGIDFKRREAYLSDDEFQAVLGMTKEAFYKLPKWKQDMNKKKVDLF